MRTLNAIEIAVPVEKAFWTSQNYQLRTKWDPFLSHAELLGAQPDVGVQANCISRLGIKMITEYVSFVPPKVAAIKMVVGPFILKSFAASWNFEYLGEQHSRVRFHYSFQLVWYLKFFEPLLHGYFIREMEKRLSALKGICESNIEAV